MLKALHASGVVVK